ncbi:hypothetical protein SESBI_50718 [Sesbania bispinosa]|nr:hypothetical protein SESBI_50718 [Sesbania bispinosa]
MEAKVGTRSNYKGNLTAKGVLSKDISKEISFAPSMTPNNLRYKIGKATDFFNKRGANMRLHTAKFDEADG